MQNRMTKEEFDQYINKRPESKLELIDGRLIVGNGLRGSRFLLWDILNGYTPLSAFAFVPLNEWKTALVRSFRPASGGTDLEWAKQYRFDTNVEPAGPPFNWQHYHVAAALRMGLFTAIKGTDGTSLGGDFVMKLGDSAFTPDALVLNPKSVDRLHSYYLDGAADIAIEVLLPGHEAQDNDFKRRCYAEGGVPEYWIADPAKREMKFLRLVEGAYQPFGVNDNGRYQPAINSNLSITPGKLWEILDDESRDWELTQQLFEVANSVSGKGIRSDDSKDDDLGWGYLPHNPRISMRPTKIKFDEFISWTPRAKFEVVDGKPLIESTLGTRNTLSMLLMTFGLEEAVRIMHPKDWAAAIRAEEDRLAGDRARKDEWWKTVRRATALLRDKFNVSRVTVIGDLVHSEPLNMWSSVTLVLASDSDKHHEMYDAIYAQDEEHIIADLVSVDRLSRASKFEFEKFGVVVD